MRDTISGLGHALTSYSGVSTKERVTPSYWPNSEMAKIDQIVAQLDRDLKTTLILRYQHGLDYKSIGKHIGYSERQVGTRLKKAAEQIERGLK